VQGANKEIILHITNDRQNSRDSVIDVGSFMHYITGYLSVNISKAYRKESHKK